MEPVHEPHPPGPPAVVAATASPVAPPAPAPAVSAPARSRRKRVVLALLLLLALYLGWEAVTWPDVAGLATANPETTAFIERYRRRAEGQGRPAPQQRWVPIARVSRHLGHAVLVAEDIEFFDHDGFSRHELRAALEQAWEEKKLPRGASTITQQLAKNLWLSPSYNPLRKVKEAILTWQLERSLSKRRILELYLNVVEFGPGVYGAEAAARHYYGTSARSLSAYQAASLAAGLPRPRSWHPGVASRSYQRRVASIQRRMRKTSWLAREL